ncbi:hypothetical protein B0T19DRAFT_294446 [Cercophora scortea]|uniref:Uncharacterized protein n=1 Tax=Cercophora scortea TaxID=314031 RepID=A0AAE0M3R0_9PEZI|nr:hypothetical protein B0T19DRAFT_294446 [Cercophora scortea]
MRFTALVTFALFGALSAACNTRDDCPGDQVCCARCSGNACAVFICVEPTDACCSNTLGLRGFTSSCDICSSPGVFDSPCS